MSPRKRLRSSQENTSRSQRRRLRSDEDSDATEGTEVDSDEEMKQSQPMSRSSSSNHNRSSIQDDSIDEDGVEESLDFTQTDYAVEVETTASQVADRATADKKSPSVPSRIAQLDEKQVEDLTALLVRYLLYKGMQKLPVRFTDISKEVYPTYKNVSRYFFHRAKKRLEKVFGFRVVAMEDTARETYLVLNKLNSQEHLLLLNKNQNSKVRGLLMMVIGLLWCAPSRSLSEDDLWTQLTHIDSNITPGRKHRQLGDVAAHLKTFEAQSYLIGKSDVDADHKKIRILTYGPRALQEVGKPQILHFVCKLITGRPPTDEQIDELALEDE